MSRLECMQTAVDTQLKRLMVQKPNAVVLLVAFNNEVTLVGDGSSHPVVITGDKLNDYEALMKIGSSTDLKAFKPIGESSDALSKKVSHFFLFPFFSYNFFFPF